MMDAQNEDNPDVMSVGIAVLGYGGAAVLLYLLFSLAAPVTG